MKTHPGPRARRILPKGAIPHEDLSEFVSETQEGSVRPLDVFARNLADIKNPRFCRLDDPQSIVDPKRSGVAFSKEHFVFTDTLILRGDYSSLTICIYGQAAPSCVLPYRAQQHWKEKQGEDEEGDEDMLCDFVVHILCDFSVHMDAICMCVGF